MRTLVLFILLLNACHIPDNKKINVKVHNQNLICELAQTQEQRAKGLMHRSKLAKNHGMLFVFSQEYAWPFWMKNTLIPLDIIWMDKNKKIVHILKNLSPCPKGSNHCPSYFPPSTVKSKYVLELNSGQSDAIELKLNEHLNFSIEQ